MMSRPEPSSVSGPKPRIPKVKIVGNMTEWHNPMAIKLHMASEPHP
jgi:hypothetical protein